LTREEAELEDAAAAEAWREDFDGDMQGLYEYADRCAGGHVTRVAGPFFATATAKGVALAWLSLLPRERPSAPCTLRCGRVAPASRGARRVRAPAACTRARPQHCTAAGGGGALNPDTAHDREQLELRMKVAEMHSVPRHLWNKVGAVRARRIHGLLCLPVMLLWGLLCPSWSLKLKRRHSMERPSVWPLIHSLSNGHTGGPP
jgi:hypothetical protein